MDHPGLPWDSLASAHELIVNNQYKLAGDGRSWITPPMLPNCAW